MSRERIEQFFSQVVIDYSCGDVKALLDANLSQAGPLLASVVNGIDLVGGMMQGFSEGSQKRSCEFMRKHLNLSEPIAKLLYSLVRCGVSHEGSTKQGLVYFVHPVRPHNLAILSRDHENAIWLNVSELARQYLTAVDMIAMDIHGNLSHVPAGTEKDETVFTNALAFIHVSIDEFCLQLQDEENIELYGDPVPRGSCSPFLSEFLDQFRV